MYDYREAAVMIARVADYAREHGLVQTLSALRIAAAAHDGQYRSGADHIPYIVHPLSMACSLIAMRIVDDGMLAATLLHDVCEDCGYKPEDLPVEPATRQLVSLLTRDPEGTHAAYYSGISESPNACLIKCLDRINNMSEMAKVFSKQKIENYTREARRMILPLIEVAKNGRPDLIDAIREVEYHLTSLIEIYENLPA